MGIARKLVVSANEEGLVLQQIASKGQRHPQTLLVKYEDALVSSIPRESAADPAPSTPSFEAFGVIGTCPRRQQRDPASTAGGLLTGEISRNYVGIESKLPHYYYAP